MSQSHEYAVVDEIGEGNAASNEGPLGKCRRGEKKCVACALCGGCCGLSLLSMILFVVISNLTAKPVSDEISVFFDGWTQNPVPRKMVAGNTSELLYEWSMSDMGIKAITEGNATTSILLPIAKMVQAEFLRTNHMTGVKEYGISRQMWSPNPISVFGNKTNFFLVEKMHVRSHEGPWSEKNVEHVQRERGGQGSFTRWIARKMRGVRGVLLHMFLFQRIGFVAAFLDDDILASGVAHVENNSAIPTAAIVEGMAAMTKELETTAASGAKHPKYELSMCNCFHFDKDPLVKQTEDGLQVPLDRMLVAHRGQTVFAPRQEFSVNTGVAILRLDAFSKKLRLFYAARAELVMSTVADLPDTEMPPAFYLAPSDFGSELYNGPDNRWAEGGERSWVAWTLHWLLWSIPMDYDYLHMDSKQLCPDSVHERLSETLSSTDMVAFVRGEKTLAQGLSLSRVFSRTVDCSTEYLGAGSNEASPSADVDRMHGYGFWEAAVWAHAFLELPQDTRATIMTSREWNNFPPP